jgi:hypothetical protein
MIYALAFMFALVAALFIFEDSVSISLNRIGEAIGYNNFRDYVTKVLNFVLAKILAIVFAGFAGLLIIIQTREVIRTAGALGRSEGAARKASLLTQIEALNDEETRVKGEQAKASSELAPRPASGSGV